jgi:2-methylcitrate dehydratase PrpD
MTASATSQLARFAAETTPDDLPDGVAEAIRASIIDTVAVMVAGQSQGRGVSELLEITTREFRDGQATIVGHAGRFQPRAAATVNGAMTHQLDFDDTHDSAVVHPTANSLPISLALAETRGASGAELLTAVAVGNEVACRMGKALTRLMFEYPWVRPPVLGMFGAVAAGGRMLGLSADEIENAWGLLLPRAAGTLACLVEPGSWVRTMRDAFSADSAALALSLAQAGVQGDRLPLEGKYGLFEAYFDGDYSVGTLTEGLGSEWAVEEVSLKPWACCREVHGNLTALFDIIEKHSLRARDISEIRIKVGATNIKLCEPAEVRRHPRQKADALCNLPFNLAVAATHGRIPLDIYTPEGLADPAVRAMAERVSWETDETQDRHGTLEPGAVQVVRTDGSVVAATAEIARGHPQLPLTPAQLKQKYLDCFAVSEVLGSPAATELHESLSVLHEVRDVNELTRLLRPVQP